MSFTRAVTFGISGRAKLPTEGWVTRHLRLAQFGFSKLLSLSFHFIPPEVMHKVHCEINGVLKWLLTMSSYWYVFSWNYSTKYFFLPYSSLPKSSTRFCLRVKTEMPLYSCNDPIYMSLNAPGNTLHVDSLVLWNALHNMLWYLWN